MLLQRYSYCAVSRGVTGVGEGSCIEETENQKKYKFINDSK